MTCRRQGFCGVDQNDTVRHSIESHRIFFVVFDHISGVGKLTIQSQRPTCNMAATLNIGIKFVQVAVAPRLR